MQLRDRSLRLDPYKVIDIGADELWPPGKAPGRARDEALAVDISQKLDGGEWVALDLAPDSDHRQVVVYCDGSTEPLALYGSTPIFRHFTQAKVRTMYPSMWAGGRLDTVSFSAPSPLPLLNRQRLRLRAWRVPPPLVAAPPHPGPLFTSQQRVTVRAGGSGYILHIHAPGNRYVELWADGDAGNAGSVIVNTYLNAPEMDAADGDVWTAPYPGPAITQLSQMVVIPGGASSYTGDILVDSASMAEFVMVATCGPVGAGKVRVGARIHFGR